MEAYSVFAKLYDDFMADIPYETWGNEVAGYLQKNDFKDCKILELGCGTGTMSIKMAEHGYLVEATDLSASMLDVATRKIKKYPGIVLKQQDMRALNLSAKYPVVLSLCDSINYMLDTYELSMVFEGVTKCLAPKGIFLFDLKTIDFYRELGENTYTDEISKGSYVWENDFDEETGDNDYYISFYVKTVFGLYKKYIEEHTQHAFLEEEVMDVATKNGFTLKDKFTVEGSPERVYYAFERKE